MIKLFIFFAIISLNSCKTKRPHGSEVKFIAANYKSILLEKVHNQREIIVEIIHPEYFHKGQEKLYQWVEKATLEWIEVLKVLNPNVANKIIVKQANIKFDQKFISKLLGKTKPILNEKVALTINLDPDFYIPQYNGDDEFSKINSLYYPNLNIIAYKPALLKHRRYQTILHEIGHAFGLLDTYPRIVGEFESSLQPDSIMKATSKNMSEDDRMGIKYKYCSIFPKVCDPSLYYKVNEGMKVQASLESIQKELRNTMNGFLPSEGNILNYIQNRKKEFNSSYHFYYKPYEYCVRKQKNLSKADSKKKLLKCFNGIAFSH